MSDSREEQEGRMWEEAMQEVEDKGCPCGHESSRHEMLNGQCLECDCPQFGEPVESWEEFTEVNVGDGPGGFRVYE